MLPLAWRRRYPLTVLVIVGGVFLVYRYVGVWEGTASSIALFLALYSAGALSQHPARDWVRGGVVAVSLVVVVAQLIGQQEYVGFDLLVFSSYTIATNVAYFVAGWLLGNAERTRRRYERELEQRAIELAAEREDRARRAVLDERVRIARELHDVVAHHVSVMGVQAPARAACWSGIRSVPPRRWAPWRSRAARRSASCSGWSASSGRRCAR
jgi:signal transduction histidine kinase